MKKTLLCVYLIFSLLLCACGQTAPSAGSNIPTPSTASAGEAHSGGSLSRRETRVSDPSTYQRPSTAANTPETERDSLQPSASLAARQADAQQEVADEPQTTSQATTPSITQRFAQQTTSQYSQESVSKPSQNTPPVTPSADSGKCTVSILCVTAVGKSDAAPSTGRFLSSVTVTLSGGETVYDVLKSVCQANDIPLVGSSGYVKSIGGLAERDCGGGSGWLYRVNGEFPGVGCGSYPVSDGDRIEWIYTCEMGNDL